VDRRDDRRGYGSAIDPADHARDSFAKCEVVVAAIIGMPPLRPASGSLLDSNFQFRCVRRS
jgi:hypothetical protein